MPWRLEYAKTARGGCTMAECKHADAKIRKDSIKLGYWIETSDKSFWQWRHWGCTTQKVLENIKNDVDEDPEGLDGFEELMEKDQDRVTLALTTGSIAEEDVTVLTAEEEANLEEYQADEERLKVMKREAKENDEKWDLKAARARLQDERNARRKMIKDAAKAEEKAAKQVEKEASKAAKEAEKEEKKLAREAAKAAKANGTKKRKQVKDEDESDATEGPAVKKQVRGKAETVAGPRKSGRATKKAIKAESEDDDDEEIKPEPKPKVSRSKKAVKAESEDDDEGDRSSSEEIKPKPKSSRGQKAAKAKPAKEQEQPKSKARATRGKKVKQESDGEDEHGDEYDGDSGGVEEEEVKTTSKVNGHVATKRGRRQARAKA